jgi:hypothetical protein
VPSIGLHTSRKGTPAVDASSEREPPSRFHTVCILSEKTPNTLPLHPYRGIRFLLGLIAASLPLPLGRKRRRSYGGEAPRRRARQLRTAVRSLAKTADSGVNLESVASTGLASATGLPA